MPRFFLTLLAIVALLPACSAVSTKPDASMGDTPSHGPVGRTMKEHSAKFIGCARDAVTVQTGTTQHIQLRFNVDAQGNVQKARIDRMSAPDPDLHGCVLYHLRKIQFPKPNDGKTKEITYPLVLKPE